MPKVLIYITLRSIWEFFFLWNDKNENRAHIHVTSENGKPYAKIWLEPEISIAKKGGLSDSEIKQVLKIANETKKELLESWKKYKKGEEIKPINIKTTKKKL